MLAQSCRPELKWEKGMYIQEGGLLNNALAEEVLGMANDNLLCSTLCIGWTVLMWVLVGDLGVFVGPVSAVMFLLVRSLWIRNMAAAIAPVGWLALLTCVFAIEYAAIVYFLSVSAACAKLHIHQWYRRPRMLAKYLPAALILPLPLVLPLAITAREVFRFCRPRRPGQTPPSSSAT